MCVILFLFTLLPDSSCSCSTSWSNSTAKYFILPCTYHLYSLVSSPSCLNPFKPPPPHDTLLLLMSCIHTDIVTCTCTFMPLFCMKKKYSIFDFFILDYFTLHYNLQFHPVSSKRYYFILSSLQYVLITPIPFLHISLCVLFFPAIKSNLCSSCILGCVTFQFAKTVDNFNNYAYQRK